jgi:lysophospholipase L1-like esterase
MVDHYVHKWGLQAPSTQWRSVDLINGTTLETFSGDFADCAQYGARTDDLLDGPHYQVETCMPETDRNLVTLVIMTIGGNDIYSLLEDVNDGVDEATLRQTFATAIELLRNAVAWVKTPGRFPNGVFMVIGNIYDFSDDDGAEDMAQCTGAQLIGLSPPLRDPIFQDIIFQANQEILSIVVDNQIDMIFLGENFCGHGFNTDPGSRCYRGPHAVSWLDAITCEHPNTAGTAALASMFEAVIEE